MCKEVKVKVCELITQITCVSVVNVSCECVCV